MIASCPLGTTFHVTGTAATQYSRTEACAGAAAAAMIATAAASAATARNLTASADLQRALHPGVDAAHEVQRRSLLGAHVHLGGRLRVEGQFIPDLVDPGAAHVHDRLGRVSVGVGLERGEERFADRAGRSTLEDLPQVLRLVLLLHDRERVRLGALVLERQLAARLDRDVAGDVAGAVL